MFVREVVRNTYHVLALLSSGLNQVLIAVHYQVRDKWRDRGESASGERRGEGNFKSDALGKSCYAPIFRIFKRAFPPSVIFYVLQIWCSF